MGEQVKCPNCREQLLQDSTCAACGGSGNVAKKLYNRYYSLASILRKTQIKYKYFEIENLLLINISLTQDPNRFQEYAVFRSDEDGGYTQVESVTVNARPIRISSLAGLLMSISRQPLTDFETQIRAYDDFLTPEDIENFKRRFAIYEAGC